MDITLAETRYLMFTTRAFATGIPTVLAGSPVISAYENDSTAQITAGITLGVSHDSVVGMNLITVVATGANGYESGKDYNFVITTGTVGGVSVVGEVVGTFSIDASAALKAVDLLNDIAATDIVSAGAITTSSGAVSTVSTVTDGATASALATIDSNVDAILFDTAEIGVAGAGLTNINLPDQAMDITGNLSGSVGSVTAINTTGGAIDDVTLVATTTTNTDMRGTDSAFLAGNAPTNFSDMSITATNGLVDITQIGADKVWATTVRKLTDGIVKNQAFSNFEFLMVLASDHVTPATGLTVTGQRSINGGAFGSTTGTIAEVSNGIYQIDLLAADTNGDVITYRFSSATADDTFVTVITT